jgi:hypothetical protein
MFGSRNQGGAGHCARRIKDWARELLGAGEEASILVSELACSEPGCPPIETVIAILDGPGSARRYKLHRPSAEVTREDVARLAAPEGAGA